MEDSNMNYFKAGVNPEWVIIVDKPTKTVEVCVKVNPNAEYGDNSQRAVGRDINTYKRNSKQQVLDLIAAEGFIVPEEVEIPD